MWCLSIFFIGSYAFWVVNYILVEPWILRSSSLGSALFSVEKSYRSKQFYRLCKWSFLLNTYDQLCKDLTVENCPRSVVNNPFDLKLFYGHPIHISNPVLNVMIFTHGTQSNIGTKQNGFDDTHFFIRKFFWPSTETFLALSWFQYYNFLKTFLANFPQNKKPSCTALKC